LPKRKPGHQPGFFIGVDKVRAVWNLNLIGQTKTGQFFQKTQKLFSTFIIELLV